MLTEKQMQQLREHADSCSNPLYLFDNDADGLSSFLLLRSIIKEGRGYSCRTGPELSASFSSFVREDVDVVFILDKPMVSSAFFEMVKKPIVWVDHHMPAIVPSKNVTYINPRQNDFDSYFSTTSCIYETFKDRIDQHLWIAATGMLGDWCIPAFLEQVKEKYPNYLSIATTVPEITQGDVREMIHIFSLVQKGEHTTIRKAIDALMRVKDPYEILKQTSAAGEIVWKKFQAMNAEYEEVYENATIWHEGNVVVCVFQPIHSSFTKEIASDLVLKHQGKVILVLRTHEDLYVGSIRGEKVLSRGEVALKGVRGSIGGHEEACGININQADLKAFIEAMNHG